jgi:chromosome segregation ATPase
MTFRSESNISTNRLIAESDNLAQKYNQYKRNLNLAKGLGNSIEVVTSGDLEYLFTEVNNKNQILTSELVGVKHQYDTLVTDHDIEVKKMADEYLLKITRLQNEVGRYKSEHQNLCEQLEYYEERYKQVSTDNDENRLEVERLNKVISVLEIDLNLCDNKFKEKQSKLEAFQQELTVIQTQHFELNLKHKKLIEDNRTLQTQLDIYEKDRKELFDKYNSYNDDMQKSENERLEIQERKFKEKNCMLKKKIKELKALNDEIEDEIKSEKKNSLDTKISYSRVISKMQEDMKLIKTEWEKKCKDEASDYDRIISDLETKHGIEINNLKHDFQIELESKNREVAKYKQSADLLKNFEKEYIRIEKHEEMLNSAISELKKKLNQDLQNRQDELDNDLKRRLQKIDEEKRAEYETLTVNTRKTLKQLEKHNEELRGIIADLQGKLSAEQESNQSLKKSMLDIKTNKDVIDRNLAEQANAFAKLEKEYKSLYEQYQETLLKAKEGTFKLQQYDQEVKGLQSQIVKLKADNDVLNETMEKLKHETKKERQEYYESTEQSKRDAVRKLQISLQNMSLLIVRLKGKYQQEITNLKTEVESLTSLQKSKL